MNREIYGALIGLATLTVLLLPLPLFVAGVALLSLLMARELSFHLGLESLWFSALFGPALFYVHPSAGALYIALMSLSYGYVRWNLDLFMRALFVLFYTGFFPSYLINLKEEGTYLLLVFFLTIWANDVFAYYTGRRFGRHPLLPRLSPRKTVEGFVGGILAGVLLFFLLSGMEPLRAILTALLTLLTGVAGDYFKSFVKRQLGIKDFSTALGQHGGFVDRFDAVIFSAPVFYWLISEL